MTSSPTSTMTSSPTSTVTTTIQLQDSVFNGGYVAGLVILGLLVLIAIPIAYTYCKLKKSERSVGSVTPRHAPHYSNPVYQATHDITQEYRMESTIPEDSADYMDVFEDDDRNI